MMTDYKFNARTNEQPKDKKLVLDFLEELRFDVEHAGNKSNRGKLFGKLL